MHNHKDTTTCLNDQAFKLVKKKNKKTKTQIHPGVEHLHQVALDTLLERQRQVSCDSSTIHNHKDTDTCGHSASPSGGITHINRETKTHDCDSSTKRNHKDTNTCGHSVSPPGGIKHINRETKT